MPTCYLIGAGDFTARDFAPRRGDLVIAADAGYRALQATGREPDLLVGDFDSLADRPAGVEALAFPPEKDDTDMGLALSEGWARGYRDFALYGADGGRLDHTVANLQLLGGASRRGASVRLIGRAQDVFALTNGTLALPPREPGTVVSVFCHGGRALGVTLTGLRYPLNRANLTADRPLGVSNEYVRPDPTVTVEQGTLLVFVALRPEPGAPA
ncbi:MAG: thiamine diphosphokinase [Clostridiales bacterium]|nr:thiamine diphosphokinase [Clostridiales bacterium]